MPLPVALMSMIPMIADSVSKTASGVIDAVEYDPKASFDIASVEGDPYAASAMLDPYIKQDPSKMLTDYITNAFSNPGVIGQLPSQIQAIKDGLAAGDNQRKAIEAARAYGMLTGARNNSAIAMKQLGNSTMSQLTGLYDSMRAI